MPAQMESGPDYPEEWETEVVLKDGSTAKLRPIRPDDRDLLEAFHSRQSQESIYFRFFRYRPELSDKELDYFTQVDYQKRMAFVAQLGDELVAVARYETWDSPAHPGKKMAEVAFFVDDNNHGKGLATIMLEYLAAAGRQHEFDGFTATVLPENVGMLRVFRKAGFEVSTRFADGTIEVDLGIEISPETNTVIASRHRQAQARSVARLVAPGSIAVVGASRERGRVGHEVVRQLVAGGFTGPIYPINRSGAGSEIAGLDVLRTLADIPAETLDLVIVAVPASEVEAVLDDAIAVGAAGLAIISVGFSETGPEGAARERRLVERARANGLRIIGPNSFGLVNTATDVKLSALFIDVEYQAGPVGVLSQSGPLAASVLHELDRADVGVSTMVAAGNRADVSVNDLLSYWGEDDNTEVIALYLENFGNLRHFSAIARDVSKRKPIIAVAPSDPDLAKFLAHSGVILVDQIDELVEQAAMISRQPIPTGNRVAVVSNASSVARLAVAACRRFGLEVVAPASVAETTVADVVLVGDADNLNLPHAAEIDAYQEVLVAAAVSPEVDALLVALIPTPQLDPQSAAALLRRVDQAVDKPMVAAGLLDPGMLDVGGLPLFKFPEGAARVLGRSAALARWRELETDEPITASAEFSDAVRDALTEALDGNPFRVLDLADPGLTKLLPVLDLPLVDYRMARNADEAVIAAEAVGYPVVMKAGRLRDRSVGESGGAALDLADEQQVRASFGRMIENIGEDYFLPVIIQTMAPAGPHLLVELIQDPEQGGRIEVGVGGLAGSTLAPLVTAVLPTSEDALDRLLDMTWIRTTIPNEGARFVLRDLLGRLAAIASASPIAGRISCNPVLVRHEQLAVVDLAITLRPWRHDPLAEVRHLD